MRKVLPLVVSLFCCVFFYVVIWNKIQGTWSVSRGLYYVVSESGFFWRDRHETTKHVTPAFGTPLNLLSKKTTKSTVKEDILDSLHHIKSHQEAPLGSRNLTTSVTTIPVLYKEDFNKLPEWDFEDVYLRNNEESRPVCSKSLQKSKDKKFQAAIIPNIQLWLHKGHLNVSEWNRLSHFNNPFGFMEYKYNDVKSSVDLIPKPKSTQLLPVPESAHDGCVRCAVVGTGGILSGSRKGKEIDSHHYVFRMNGAVTKGFEEDVGNKTSVYVHTSYALLQSVYHLRPDGFTSAPKDEGIKYVLIPEGMRDFEWIQSLFQKNTVKKGDFKGFSPLSFYGGRIKKDRFYVLHPDFLRYIRNRFLQSKSLNENYWHLYRPTNGAFTLFLALHTCDIVNVYGFITADHNRYSNYYFDKGVKTSVVFFINHDYNLEIQTWKKLHDSGIINIYQRQENLKET